MQENNSKPNFEFIALMASLMSIVALAIDALLPALAIIGESVGSVDPTKNQLLIIMIFLGLGSGSCSLVLCPIARKEAHCLFRLLSLCTGQSALPLGP